MGLRVNGFNTIAIKHVVLLLLFNLQRVHLAERFEYGMKNRLKEQITKKKKRIFVFKRKKHERMVRLSNINVHTHTHTQPVASFIFLSFVHINSISLKFHSEAIKFPENSRATPPPPPNYADQHEIIFTLN